MADRAHRFVAEGGEKLLHARGRELVVVVARKRKACRRLVLERHVAELRDELIDLDLVLVESRLNLRRVLGILHEWQQRCVA